MSRVLGRQSASKCRISSLWFVIGAVVATVLCLGAMISYHQLLHPVSTSVAQTATISGQPNQIPEKTKSNFRVREPAIPRYAFAITITKDGFFMDGAAVLAYSIFKQARQANYQISLVAFIHPNVTIARPYLTKLGFHVIEVPIPINVSCITSPFLREKINKNGCCGSSELIKLSSYRLLQYDKVVHLDADVILLQNLDPILPLPYSLVYTTDPNMATFKKHVYQMPVQGGFLLLRPSLAVYRQLVFTETHTDFVKSWGWNRSMVGWYWGGMTVQGLLPYFYYKVAPTLPQPLEATPNVDVLLVDRCVYNTMADTDNCTKYAVEQIRSAHFTVCQKPWNCFIKYEINPLCGQLHRKWHELRAEAELFYGIGEGKPLGGCAGEGLKHYRPLALDRAALPAQGSPFHALLASFRPDDSPDRLDPVEEGGYVGDKFD